jgi:hypothetical protein
MDLTQAEAVQFQLVDMVGRIIQQKNLPRQFGHISQTFDLSTQPAGIYLVQLNIAGKRISSRILKR